MNSHELSQENKALMEVKMMNISGIHIVFNITLLLFLSW